MSEVKLDKTMLVHIRPEETIIPDIKSLQIDNALEQNRLNFEAKKEEIYRNKLQGQQQELERYKNIIDELEKWLLEQLYIETESPYEEKIIKIENPEIASILNKLKKLKGDDK